MAKAKYRQAWLATHRWLGLTAGFVFSLIGLTGSVLVFDHAIDEWLNPKLLLAEQGGVQRQSIQTIIAAAEQATGQTALSLSKPRTADGVYEVWFQTGSEADPKFQQVLVDPYTANVNGSRIWGDYFMTWVYRLHFRLLGGAIGGMFVGVVGLLVLASLISGIYLWWPLWKNSLRAAFSVRRGKRNYDIHKTFGIASSLLLSVITFTGVYMEFPTVFQGLLGLVSPISQHPEDLRSASPEGLDAKPLSADDAIRIATLVFPDAKFDHVHPPVGNDGVYEVAFRQSNEVQRSYGRSQVFLDQYSGEVLKVLSPDDFTASDAFLAWQFPLHNGEAFGMLGRWIVFASGFIPSILFVTGLVMVKRRNAKLATKGRSTTAKSAR
ncbi:PepSY domain-containing protein [Stieleria sp. JC731]|uniref:PepSY-associated TM helix domain-containing protein n=1 Tax=Pirellulaceae TaxID=2691357 RepID=UPI001E397599|nr:PepSY-associated TM helix domain-containing protein [Stieleria sp. JC731]MCC9599533.1 PepSY domain-containing protein [Stieleria sp. JC731]